MSTPLSPITKRTAKVVAHPDVLRDVSIGKTTAAPHYLGAFPMQTTVHDEVWCRACKQFHADANMVFLHAGETYVLSVCEDCLLEVHDKLERKKQKCPSPMFMTSR